MARTQDDHARLLTQLVETFNRIAELSQKGPASDSAAARDRQTELVRDALALALVFAESGRPLGIHRDEIREPVTSISTQRVKSKLDPNIGARRRPAVSKGTRADPTSLVVDRSVVASEHDDAVVPRLIATTT